MRNLEGNTHLSPILLYTKSTFPGLLLDRGIILPLTRLCKYVHYLPFRAYCEGLCLRRDA